MVARAAAAGGLPRVVAGRDADVDELLHRVAARLARLPLHDVEAQLAAGEHEVVEAQHHAGALGEGPRGPGRWPAAASASGIDVVHVDERQVVERSPVKGAMTSRVARTGPTSSRRAVGREAASRITQ